MTKFRFAFSFSLSLACAAVSVPLISVAPARAQAVIATVNDDPVTNIDVDQHMKILRVLHKNATREAALESVFEARLKLIETGKYKLTPTDSDIGWALGITARAIKMEPQQLLVAMQRAGVTEDQWKQKWKAEAGWLQFVRALNRSVEISENDVRGELSKQGKSTSTEYLVRQVILVVPNNASVAVLQGRFQEANQLRAKFTDCNSGVEAARATRDTAVKEPITRSASALGDQLRNVLDKTEVGKLTQPSRGPQGIEMIAVCGKSNRTDSNAAEGLRNDLLMKRLEGESQRRFQEVRAKAIIVKK